MATCRSCFFFAASAAGREFSHSSPEFALAQPGFPRGGPQQGYPPHAAQDYPPAPNQYGFPANGYGHEMAQAVSDPLFAGNAENELLVKYRIMLQYMARAKPVPLREIPRVWRDTFPSAIDVCACAGLPASARRSPVCLSCMQTSTYA